MRTATEIQAEIERLKAVKPKLKRFNFFGDDIHAAVEAQIAVLQEDLDNDAIYARYDPCENDGDPNEDSGRHTLDSALEADAWRSGDADRLAADWEEIVG